MTEKIYVASSWRNDRQGAVVKKLRDAGFGVYDFKNPGAQTPGFHWSDIDENWHQWTLTGYLNALQTGIAKAGFKSDWDAMLWADTCVLLLPCGRSAHIEAGYFRGAKKSLYILIENKIEPELMYRMADGIYGDLDELTDHLKLISDKK